MAVLHDYCEALGAIVARYGATLTNFSGDGMMVLVNAPVKCPEPALRAIEMAVEMQTTAQALISSWARPGLLVGLRSRARDGPGHRRTDRVRESPRLHGCR